LLTFHNEIIHETCEQCERKTTQGSGAAQLGSRPSTQAGMAAPRPGPAVHLASHIREAQNPGLGGQRQLNARNLLNLWQFAGLFIFFKSLPSSMGLLLHSVELFPS
jgi:hypothetical protein